MFFSTATFQGQNVHSTQIDNRDPEPYNILHCKYLACNFTGRYWQQGSYIQHPYCRKTTLLQFSSCIAKYVLNTLANPKQTS